MVNVSVHFLTPAQIKAGFRVLEDPADDLLQLWSREQFLSMFSAYGVTREGVQEAIPIN